MSAPPPRRYVIVGPLLLAAPFLALIPAEAAASVTCRFSSARLLVNVEPPDTVAALSVAAGVIQVESESGPVPCADETGAAPTVSNTDEIEVYGTSPTIVTIVDLGGGPFAPGLTPEADDSSEIEIHVNWLASPEGRSREDDDVVVVLGSQRRDVLASRDQNYADIAVNLNAGEQQDDTDLTARGEVLGAGLLLLSGRGGDDQLIGAERLLNFETFAGGRGNDVVRAGAGIDVIYGQAGNDRLLGGPERDLISGGSGRDRCVGGPGTDATKGCESGSA